MLRILSVFAAIAVIAQTTYAGDRVADWIGIQPADVQPSGVVVFHKTFKLDFRPDSAFLKFTCMTAPDFGGTTYRAYVNGAAGDTGSFWQDVQYMNITGALRRGRNRIDIEVKWVPQGPPGPILAKLTASGTDEDGGEVACVIRSDETWTYSLGEYVKPHIVTSDPGGKPVVVAGAADTWRVEGPPQVQPKLNTSTVVGVTDVRMKGGNAGSLYQFKLIRDYSDKFYFLKPLGYWSVEDYIFGQTNYQYPGQWFWGYDKQIAYNHETEGFEFTVYPWVWVPAEWYRKQHKPPMIKCLEHGQEGFGISLWSPLLLQFNEDIYSELKSNFGDSIKFIYPGIYGDFGEAHYMAGWNNWMRPKPDHQHPDFWVGDELARADFRHKMLAKYGSLEALNAAWNTSLENQECITYPKLDGSDARRYTLDFVNWYYECMTDFTARVCGIARKHFPDVPMAPKLGCGDENPMWGQDNSAIPEALARIGVGIRSTHGSSPNFAVRRISSACKFYGNAFETETAGGTNRREAARKFFIDASSGCSELFEYPNAIIKVADIFSRCRRHLRGEHSITHTALFFPTSWHRCNLRQGYPPRLVQAAEELRDMFDFDIVDENMILDGALANYNTLAMFDGNFTEQAVYDAVIEWVRAGATLLMLSDQLPFSNVEGRQLPVSDLMKEAKSGEISRREGSGEIIVWAGDWDARSAYGRLIYAASVRGTGGGIDGNNDGVWTSLFKDRMLYLNTTDEPVTVTENIPEAFAEKLGLDFLPKYLSYSVEVPAGGHAVHFLDRPFVEFAMECEDMRGGARYPEEFILRGGYGTLGKAVRVESGGWLKAEFSTDEEADYAFCCLADLAKDASGEIFVDGAKVGDVTGPSGPHDYMYPVNGTCRLQAGKHTLVLRFANGECAADKVVVTTDTGLAGFAYGFIDPQADQTW